MNTYELARRFSTKLKETLTAEQLAECIDRNAAELNENVCHSHDYCDANEIMLASWMAIDPDRTLHEIMHNERNAARWNIAWETAKCAHFNEEQITAEEREDCNYIQGMMGE